MGVEVRCRRKEMGTGRKKKERQAGAIEDES